jgi:hydrogenase expression/formation protein HypD
VENAYPRAVTCAGNEKAQRLMYRVFEPRDSEWRGFPVIPGSGLALRREFARYDGVPKFGLEIRHVTRRTACLCDRVLRGIADPTDCRLFGKACTPRTPVGACMVSHEGACKIWHAYKIRRN